MQQLETDTFRLKDVYYYTLIWGLNTGGEQAILDESIVPGPLRKQSKKKKTNENVC